MPRVDRRDLRDTLVLLDAVLPPHFLRVRSDWPIVGDGQVLVVVDDRARRAATASSFRRAGATTPQSGNASRNPAVAVSLLGPASTSATGNAKGNVLVAIDGKASVSGNAAGNTVVAVAGQTSASGNAHNNVLVNAGGVVSATGNASNAVSLSACGTSFTGQAAHVTVSHGVC